MNKSLYTYASIVFLLLFSFTGTAQNEYVKGEIQLSKKKKIDAYILMDFRFPQRFQNGITYITPKAYAKSQEKGKIKGKSKNKLNPKDLISFTLEDGTVYKTVKYADLTGRAIKMLPKRFILEQITDGTIDMYKFYSRTTGKISTELAKVVMDSKMHGDDMLIDYIKDNFQLLIQKESKNPKSIMMINLLNFIGDNPTVKKNYTNNHYGLRNQFTERQKMGHYVNQKFEASFVKMVDDYNGN